MAMGTRVIDDDLLDEELHVVAHPMGYIVYGDEGKALSPTFDKERDAEIWLDGWNDAMERIEDGS